MREIKFRGKRINNVGWAYGYYAKHETRQICPIGDDKLQSLEIKHLIVIDSFADWNMPRRLEGIEVIPETVGQYTGLNDKNGVEIYEGDIVIMKDEPEDIGSVAWDSHDMEWVISMATTEHKMGGYWSYELEVIGNIYDNPELIEEVK